MLHKKTVPLIAAVAFLASGLPAFAQTTNTDSMLDATSGSIYSTGTDTTTGTTTTTPGVPNTGAGGNAGNNMLILAGSALVALGATLYLRKKMTA